MKKNILYLYVLCLGIIFIVGCGQGGSGSADEQSIQGTPENDLPNADTFANQDLEQRKKAQTKGIDLKAGKRISDKASLEISSSHPEWDKPKQYYTMLFDTNEYDSFPAGLGGSGEQGLHPFHTEWGKEPWFIVDLKKEYSISQVKIWNRDEYQERMINTIVSFSTDKKNWTKIAKGKDGFGIWIIDGKNTKARYIKLQCMTEETSLHPYKMHVYGN